MAKTYDTYKDSGIAWIGKIPEKWIVGLVGKYFEEINKPNINQEETNTLQFKMGEIISKSKGDSKYSPETIEAYNVVEPGTIMINGLNLSFDLVSQRIAQVRERGAITSTYLAIFPTKKMKSNYAKYLLKAYDNNKALHAMGRGLRATLSYRTFRSEPVIVPSLDEQQAIASYLDEKCGEIDSLISLQEEMISELQDYKQSVITEAVTKGLNPNVSMKDSGVEWIGEIPNKWDVCKMQYIINLQSGHNLTTEQITDKGAYPVFGGNGIRGYYQDYSHEGDYVLIGRQGALCGNINYAHQKFWPTEHAVVCYPKIPCNYKWLGETLKAMKLGQYSLSAAQPGLSVERIKQLKLPLPPLSEQQAIASYLDEKTSQIDSLIAIKQEKITELKDYKKSIIYEYVTGKKKV